jgi:hypothetical protein
MPLLWSTCCPPACLSACLACSAWIVTFTKTVFATHLPGEHLHLQMLQVGGWVGGRAGGVCGLVCGRRVGGQAGGRVGGWAGGDPMVPQWSRLRCLLQALVCRATVVAPGKAV